MGIQHEGLMNFVSYVNTHFTGKVSPRYDKTLEPFGATQGANQTSLLRLSKGKAKAHDNVCDYFHRSFWSDCPFFWTFLWNIVGKVVMFLFPMPTEMDC